MCAQNLAYGQSSMNGEKRLGGGMPRDGALVWKVKSPIFVPTAIGKKKGRMGGEGKKKTGTRKVQDLAIVLARALSLALGSPAFQSERAVSEIATRWCQDPGWCGLRM